MDEIVKQVFLECTRAVESGDLIRRVSSTDKEYSFQNWFESRLSALGLDFDEPSRNAYPDFRLVHHPIGFEIKGLGFPGREANYDCNSQVPSGMHHGRTIYYVFGRYPSNTRDTDYPVYDLVMCHGDFLNADHNYTHENKNLKGFGSYGDLMIRDRKMYVAPTPFALTIGTERQITLIDSISQDPRSTELIPMGNLTRKETSNLIQGYAFNLVTRELTVTHIPNPNAGREHKFEAYRKVGSIGPRVTIK